MPRLWATSLPSPSHQFRHAELHGTGNEKQRRRLKLPTIRQQRRLGLQKKSNVLTKPSIYGECTLGDITGKLAVQAKWLHRAISRRNVMDT